MLVFIGVAFSIMLLANLVSDYIRLRRGDKERREALKTLKATRKTLKTIQDTYDDYGTKLGYFNWLLDREQRDDLIKALKWAIKAMNGE